MIIILLKKKKVRVKIKLLHVEVIVNKYLSLM